MDTAALKNKVKGLAEALKSVPKSVKMPLLPTHSTYDRLLVEDNAEAGGGPMGEEYSVDQRDAQLDGGENGLAGEGVAEKIMSNLFTTRGLTMCALLVTGALCLGAARGAYGGDNSSLASRISESMFFGSGQAAHVDGTYASVQHNVKKHHGGGSNLVKESVDNALEKYASRPAVMPHGDAGRAQQAFDRATKRDGASLAAALGHDSIVDVDEGRGRKGGVKGRSKGGGKVVGRRRGGKAASSGGGGGKQHREAAASLGRYRAYVDEDKAAGRGGRKNKHDEDEDPGEEDEEEEEEMVVADEEDEEDGNEFRAISDEQLAQGTSDDVGDEGDENMQVVVPTRMEHGATHQEALEQLEASIRDTVKAAHSHKQHKHGK